MEVSELLNEHPEYIDQICPEDLKPIAKLAEAGRLSINQTAMYKITARVKPPPKVNVSATPVNNEPPFASTIIELNNNHTLATTMPTEQLRAILQWSDKHYYDPISCVEETLLDDRVYDYVKRVYGQRVNGTNDKRETMKSISSATGVGIKPTRGRDAKLPISLRSLDNLYMGEGDVEKWASQHPGPYHLSAKMDGTSALYHNGVLYTRGDATMGRNISHLIPFLKLPKVPYAVRGEIVIDNTVFNQKYKDKPSRVGGQIRKINRNSVAGALGSITNIDEEFLADLSFVAYETIHPDLTLQPRPSDQFRQLKDDGFNVAQHETVSLLSDKVLSDMYHRLLVLNFEVDGVVIRTDSTYVRESDKNPDYAKAYKEALENDVAVTRIVAMEWNVSQYGYLVPTIIYEPVSIGGVTLQRATAHNAREVQKLGLGTGALIEVVYRAKVNPQVNRVLEPVPPEMPNVAYKWLASDSAGEPVNIVLNEEPSGEQAHTIGVKQVHKFLTEIGAKGIGETTVEKIFDKSGYRKVGDFINIKIGDVSFLGKQMSQNIVNSIQTAIQKVDLPTLMASSKVFGRGLGAKKFTKVFQQFPKFAETRYTYEEYVRIFKQVDGFADKTSTLAAQGMVDFWKFIDSQLSQDIYLKIIANTAPETAKDEPVNSTSPFSGKNFYLTGTRDEHVISLIKMLGGTIQSAFTSSTDVLVKKNTEYNNNKTAEAIKRGVPVYTVEEFKASHAQDR
jgi:DNA ligase (NAD+)